jgi:hypothetical protein
MLQQMVGRLFGDHLTYDLSAEERDILRLALRLARPIKLADVQPMLQCGYDTARKHLAALQNKKWLIPQGAGSKRIHAWRIDSSRRLPPL